MIRPESRESAVIIKLIVEITVKETLLVRKANSRLIALLRSRKLRVLIRVVTTKKRTGTPNDMTADIQVVIIFLILGYAIEG